ncbi:molybdopterin dehydrogenase FAD-binding [Shewanella halifaxensis HAW-EB4]|uniref:Molybdopterin dehydrogenase FAD-binding n=1 Tax=Shewanella halifaxensis (strain HAW-EB4) TaxID=458817 RepID=B0TSQ6_SHEHH|nr:molybdopterin-dependent oxidoreductase FAD-binding subunit [Shewanella halifaxensis]ABZ75231.1 molybdopterin dehydrogenase FAD-binding [Shewanella halifaxensis HAW-EB4]
MIEQFLQPDNTEQALDLMQQHSACATWFAGGSKLNAKPTLTEKTIAISLDHLSLDKIELQGQALHIGAMCRVQSLIDSELTPYALKQAATFIYSKHLRNQATLGGEIAAYQDESLLLPTLMALKAHVITADASNISIEEYLQQDNRDLILQVVIPDINLVCLAFNMTRSAAGLSIVNAAVSLSQTGETIIVIDGVSPRRAGYSTPVRLTDIEAQDLDEEALEKAVAQAVFPEADIRGSIEYKQYIAGILVTDLFIECQRLVKEA